MDADQLWFVVPDMILAVDRLSQRVTGKRRRGRLVVAIMILVLVAAGLTWALAVASDGWRNAVTAAAGVIAASATAWAAFEARRAAMSSAGSARDARLALALHNRPWPHVHLVRENGVEGEPWQWYVTTGASQLPVVRLHLTWTLDGQGKFAKYERLTPEKLWGQPSFLPATIAASEAAKRLSSVSLEWEDEEGLMRWRSAVDVTTVASEGIFNPYPMSDRLAFSMSYVVGVKNSPPHPVW